MSLNVIVLFIASAHVLLTRPIVIMAGLSSVLTFCTVYILMVNP